MANKKKEAERAASVKAIGSIKSRVIIFVVLVVETVIFILAALACIDAGRTGSGIGNTIGKATGIAVGSYQGVTKGMKMGYEAGKAEGLSAKDTDAEIANTIAKTGKLDVLIVEDPFIDVYRQGKDYAAMLAYESYAVVSVDLCLTEVVNDGSVIKVILPAPEVEIVIDESKTNKLEEWQKNPWMGSAEDGYTGYQNSMSQIKEEVKQEIGDVDFLMQQAKISAEKQVIILADSVCGKETEIQVEWKE